MKKLKLKEVGMQSIQYVNAQKITYVNCPKKTLKGDFYCKPGGLF
jgi:hypothetical protein